MAENKSGLLDDINKTMVQDYGVDSLQFAKSPGVKYSNFFPPKSTFSPPLSFAVNQYQNETTATDQSLQSSSDSSLQLTPVLQSGTKTKSPKKRSRKRYVYSKPKKKSKQKVNYQLPLTESMNETSSEQINTSSWGNESDCSADTIILDDVPGEEDKDNTTFSKCSKNTSTILPELGKILIGGKMFDTIHSTSLASTHIPDESSQVQIASGIPNLKDKTFSKLQVTPEMPFIKKEVSDTFEDMQQPVSDLASNAATSSSTSVKKTADAYISQKFLFSLLASQQAPKRRKPQTARRGKQRQDPSSRAFDKESTGMTTNDNIASRSITSNLHDTQTFVGTFPKSDFTQDEVRKTPAKKRQPAKKASPKKCTLAFSSQEEATDEQINVSKFESFTEVNEIQAAKKSKTKSPRRKQSRKKNNSKNASLREFSPELDPSKDTSMFGNLTSVPLKKKTPKKKSNSRVKSSGLSQTVLIMPESVIHQNTEASSGCLQKKKNENKKCKRNKKDTNVVEDQIVENNQAKDLTVPTLKLKRNHSNKLSVESFSIDKNFDVCNPNVPFTSNIESFSSMHIKKEVTDSLYVVASSSNNSGNKTNASELSSHMPQNLISSNKKTNVKNAIDSLNKVKYFDMSFEEDLSKKDEIDESLSLLSSFKKQISNQLLSKKQDSNECFLNTETSKKKMTSAKRGKDTTISVDEIFSNKCYNPLAAVETHNLIAYQKTLMENASTSTPAALEDAHLTSGLGLLRVKQEINETDVNNLERYSDVSASYNSARVVKISHIPHEEQAKDHYLERRIKQEPNSTESISKAVASSDIHPNNQLSVKQKGVGHDICPGYEIKNQSSKVSETQLPTLVTGKSLERTTASVEVSSETILKPSTHPFNQNSNLINLKIKKEPKDTVEKEIVLLEDTSDEETAAVLLPSPISQSNVSDPNSFHANIKKEPDREMLKEIIVLDDSDDEINLSKDRNNELLPSKHSKNTFGSSVNAVEQSVGSCKASTNNLTIKKEVVDTSESVVNIDKAILQNVPVTPHRLTEKVQTEISIKKETERNLCTSSSSGFSKEPPLLPDCLSATNSRSLSQLFSNIPETSENFALQTGLFLKSILSEKEAEFSRLSQNFQGSQQGIALNISSVKKEIVDGVDEHGRMSAKLRMDFSDTSDTQSLISLINFDSDSSQSVADRCIEEGISSLVTHSDKSRLPYSTAPGSDYVALPQTEVIEHSFNSTQTKNPTDVTNLELKPHSGNKQEIASKTTTKILCKPSLERSSEENSCKEKLDSLEKSGITIDDVASKLKYAASLPSNSFIHEGDAIVLEDFQVTDGEVECYHRLLETSTNPSLKTAFPNTLPSARGQISKSFELVNLLNEGTFEKSSQYQLETRESVNDNSQLQAMTKIQEANDVSYSNQFLTNKALSTEVDSIENASIIPYPNQFLNCELLNTNHQVPEVNPIQQVTELFKQLPETDNLSINPQVQELNLSDKINNLFCPNQILSNEAFIAPPPLQEVYETTKPSEASYTNTFLSNDTFNVNLQVPEASTTQSADLSYPNQFSITEVLGVNIEVQEASTVHENPSTLCPTNKNFANTHTQEENTTPGSSEIDLLKLHELIEKCRQDSDKIPENTDKGYSTTEAGNVGGQTFKLLDLISNLRQKSNRITENKRKEVRKRKGKHKGYLRKSKMTDRNSDVGSCSYSEALGNSIKRKTRFDVPYQTSSKINNAMKKDAVCSIKKRNYDPSEKIHTLTVEKQTPNLNQGLCQQLFSTTVQKISAISGMQCFNTSENQIENIALTSSNVSDFSVPSKDLLYKVIQNSQSVETAIDVTNVPIGSFQEPISKAEALYESKIPHLPSQLEHCKTVGQVAENSVFEENCLVPKSENTLIIQELSNVDEKNTPISFPKVDVFPDSTGLENPVLNKSLAKIDVPVNELLKILEAANTLTSAPKEILQPSLELKETYDYEHSTHKPPHLNQTLKGQNFEGRCISGSYDKEHSSYDCHSPQLVVPIVREYGHKSIADLDHEFKPQSSIESSNMCLRPEVVSQNDPASDSEVDNEFLHSISDETSYKETDSTIDTDDGLHKQSDPEQKQNFPQYKSRWEKIMERKSLEGQSEMYTKNSHLLKDYFPVKFSKDQPKGPKPIAKVQPCSQKQSLPKKPILKKYKEVHLSIIKKMARNILGKHSPSKVGRGMLGKRIQNKKKKVRSKSKRTFFNLPMKVNEERKILFDNLETSLQSKRQKPSRKCLSKTKQIISTEKRKVSFEDTSRLQDGKKRKGSADHRETTLSKKPVHLFKAPSKVTEVHHTIKSKTPTKIKEVSLISKLKPQTKMKEGLSTTKHKPSKILLDNPTALFTPDKVVKIQTSWKDHKRTKQVDEDKSPNRLYGRVTNRGTFLTQSSLNQPPKPKVLLGNKISDKVKHTSKFRTDELHSMVNTPKIDIFPKPSIPNLSYNLLYETHTQKNKITLLKDPDQPFSPRIEQDIPSSAYFQRPTTPSDVPFQTSSDSSEIFSPPDSFASTPYASTLSEIGRRQELNPLTLGNKSPIESSIPFHSSLFLQRRTLLPDPIPPVSSKVSTGNFPAFYSSSSSRSSSDLKDGSGEGFWKRVGEGFSRDGKQLPPINLRVGTQSQKVQPFSKAESFANRPRTTTPTNFPTVPHNPNRSQHKQSRSRQTKCICLPSRTLKASVGQAMFETPNVLLLILEWNVDWLIQQQKNHDPPPISTVVRKVVNTYEDIKDYYNTYFPLLLLETWQRIYVSWTHLHQASPHFCEIKSYKVEKNSIKVDCQTVFKCSDAERGIFPEKGNVIMIKFGTKEKGGIKILGYITNVIVKAFDPSNDPQNTCYRTLKYTAGEVLQRLVMTFIGAYTSDDFDRNQLIRIQVLCNIDSTLKQNDALMNVKESPLYKNVIDPLTDGLRAVTIVSRSSDASNMNEKVTECVREIIKGILSPHPLPLLTIAKALPSSDRLLVLPPLIEKMKNSYNSKVLLCTRTSKALTDIGFNLDSSNIKMVIIGKRADVHQKLRKYLLEDLATVKVNLTFGEQMLNSTLLEERTKYEAVENAKKDVVRECNVILSLIRNCHTDFLKEVCSEDDGIARMCCIIDEANLCTEPEIQIPLLYGISKLILIGDPDVPAKVCSKTAINYDYNRSLFHRAYELDVDSDTLF